MPISQELLEILCCPTSRTPLRMLGAERVGRLNRAVEAGALRYADGSPVEQPLEEALMTTDGATVYRIDASIPVMLAERAIPAAQVEGW